MIKAYKAEIVYSLPFDFENEGKLVTGYTYCILYDTTWGKKLGLVNSYEKTTEKEILIGLVDGKIQIIKL